ncbi:MAG: DUF1844 domain-containing protein [Planctomycetaceae bacterium]|nr:DUF1844 domain-containing protein [Planctomycetales bacterium]MCB9922511.1 DUF1844 domain-containing protein [Planctomycetaceae bacterium]
MSEEEVSKPEIIVDDDWKERAQAEKEQLQRDAEAKHKTESIKPEAGQAKPDSAEPSTHEQLPPASFPVLVMSLATQALASMGQIPGADGKPVVTLDHAKHFIDTLGVLEEKTKGNLSAEESGMLENALHELRLLFVAVGKQHAATKNESAKQA